MGAEGFSGTGCDERFVSARLRVLGECVKVDRVVTLCSGMSGFCARHVLLGAALGVAFGGCAPGASNPTFESEGGRLAGVAGSDEGSAAGAGFFAGGSAATFEAGAANGGGGGAPTSAGAAAAGSGAGGVDGGASGGSAPGSGGSDGLAGGGSAGAGGLAGRGGASAGGQSGSGGVLSEVTVWIAGDSTVATGGPCPIGWGGRFKSLFNGKVTVNNSAVGGRSVRTWLYDVQDTKDGSGECNLAKDAQGNPTPQARWTAMLSGMKTGDYLFIQFGINDGDSACPRHVGSDAFKASYGLMAQAAKDRGAIPIFVTPVSQIACSGSTVSKGTREPYVSATKAVGTQFGAAVIDLNALSTALYQSLGFCPIPGGDVSASTTGAVGSFFCDDHTHFDTTGATQIAGLVASALKAQNIPLAKYLL